MTSNVKVLLVDDNPMGNFVMELADGAGTKSLHILIIGVKGSQLHFAGVGKPAQPSPLNLAEDKDSDFLFLKPMFDNMRFPNGRKVSKSIRSHCSRLRF